jgi:hypothetical protein
MMDAHEYAGEGMPGEAHPEAAEHGVRFDGPSAQETLTRPDGRRDMEALIERQVRKVAAHVRARPLTTVTIALFAAYLTGRAFRD